MKKKFTCIFLVLLLVFSFNTYAFAAVNDKPIPYYGANRNNVEENFGQIKNDTVFNNNDSILTPNHFDGRIHNHFIDTITNRYDGYRERGEQARGTNTRDYWDRLNFSISHTISNNWYASIAFEKNAVTSTVGYDVGYSETRTWGYECDIAPHTTAYIGLREYYHVTEFTCHTDTVVPPAIVAFTTDGTGWSEQWFSYELYSYQ